MQETCAIRDVLALMCLHLSSIDATASGHLAVTLERIATDDRHQQTAAFVGVAKQMSNALAGRLSCCAASRRERVE